MFHGHTSPGAQPEVPLPHRKKMRRRLVLGGSVVLLTILVLANWSLIAFIAGRLADKVALSIEIARLYTKEPDQRLSMPVQNVARTSIANTWHAPRGNNRQHEGQDIFAPQGTPVLSATDGYVTNIGWNNLGGNTVSVTGAGGRTYYYAHLDSYAPLLAEGDRVTRQTVLGYVGTTGNAQGTPPHLHFGVYTFSGAINPLPFIVDRHDKESNLARKTKKAVDDRKKKKIDRTTAVRRQRQNR